MLNALVDSGGRVVDRDRLRREAGLRDLNDRSCDSALVGIRRALGQDAVVTVRRRGWRLNPDVTAVALIDHRVARLSHRRWRRLDLARLLLDLLVVVAAAKLAAEGAERLGVPAVLGEIVAGILVGPSVFGLVELGGERGVSLGLLGGARRPAAARAGRDGDGPRRSSVLSAGRRCSSRSSVSPCRSLVGTGGLGGVSGSTAETAIFLGAALTATSVGITARVFGDLRALATIEARHRARRGRRRRRARA